MPKLIRHQMASGIQEACEELLANSNEWAFLKSLLQSVEAVGYAASAKPETIVCVAQSLESSLRKGSAGEMDQILRWRRLGHLLRNLSYSGDMVALAMQQLELGYHAEALTLRESGELEMLRAVCDFLGSLSRARPIVFDVGANCGEWMHAVSVLALQQSFMLLSLKCSFCHFFLRKPIGLFQSCRMSVSESIHVVCPIAMVLLSYLCLARAMSLPVLLTA